MTVMVLHTIVRVFNVVGFINGGDVGCITRGVDAAVYVVGCWLFVLVFTLLMLIIVLSMLLLLIASL